MNVERDLCIALDEVKEEVRDAVAAHGVFASGHDGYAVIQEEVDELWDEVKAKCGYTSYAYIEAKQVAATAIKYMLMVKKRNREANP